MKVVLDTAKVTVPVGSFFSDVARGIREANLNRKARKYNRQIDNAIRMLARAEELRATREAAPKRASKKPAAKKVAAKKARR